MRVIKHTSWQDGDSHLGYLNDAHKPVETPARRNPMLADTDPTDEELHLVMCEARDVALQRKQASETWMREQMENALREAKARVRTHGR